MSSLNYSNSNLPNQPTPNDENQSKKLVKNAIKSILKTITKSLKPLTQRNPQSK